MKDDCFYLWSLQQVDSNFCFQILLLVLETRQMNGMVHPSLHIKSEYFQLGKIIWFFQAIFPFPSVQLHVYMKAQCERRDCDD